MAFVYLLRCADDSLYCGWTTDVERRLAAVLPMADRSAARREEARIKRLPRAAKLRLVEGARSRSAA
jgi:putative endonuclease